MGLSQGVPRISCPGHPWHWGSRCCVTPSLCPPDPLWWSEREKLFPRQEVAALPGGGCASSISSGRSLLAARWWLPPFAGDSHPLVETPQTGLVPKQGLPRAPCLGTPSCRPLERGDQATGPHSPPAGSSGQAAPGALASGFWAQRGCRAHAVPSPVCVLQAQTQELEELNKELRQCNLQQFIQQTGATVTVLQARSEEDAQPEPSPRELPACRRDGGQHAGSARGCSAGPPPAPCLPFQRGLAPPPGGSAPKPASSALGAEVRQQGRGFGAGTVVTHRPGGPLKFASPGAPSSSSPLKPQGCS